MMRSMYPEMPVKLVNEDAQMPCYAHEGDAGMDLCAMEDVTLKPQEWKMIGSGIACAIPMGFVGLVMPRSGLGCKGLVLKNTIGVIDSGYRGEIKLTLFNNNEMHHEGGYIAYTENRNGTIHIHKGDRVAQLLIMPVARVYPQQADDLSDTARGVGGFGSTGISGGERL